MSEIDFLTQNLGANDNAIVFYIGAAPFDHGAILSSFFPKAKFWLCDARSTWSSKLTPVIDGGRMITSEVLFDLDFATLIANLFQGEDAIAEIVKAIPTLNAEQLLDFIQGANKFLFVSDIRSTETNTLGHVQHEFNIHEDMLMQLEAAKIIAAGLPNGVEFRSSLKFRLPFIPEIGGIDYSYGSGSLHIQPWGPTDTTELRLWWQPSEDQSYNKIMIEEVMMYHNFVLRSAKFGQPRFPGYCECHDCHYEIMILMNFIGKFRSNLSVDVAFKYVTDTIDSGFGLSLAKKADRKHTDDNYFVVLNDRMGSNKLKFDPKHEIDRVGLYIRVKKEFVKQIKGDVKLSEEILERVFDEFTIYRIYMRSDLNGDVQIFRITDVDQAAEILAGIIASHGFTVANPITLRTVLDALNANMKTHYVQMVDEWRDHRADTRIEISKIGGKASNFHISAILGPEKKVSTIGFHKDVLRRFLLKSEREYDLSDSDIRKETVVLTRAYAVLKRYGTIWIDHFALALTPLYEKNPELPGILAGGTIFNATNDSFMAMYPDLELGYTDNVNLSLLDPERRIVDNDFVTVFYPNIQRLWEDAIKMWQEVILSGSRKITIVFVVPKVLSPLVTSDMEQYHRGTYDYQNDFFHTLRNEYVKPEVPHSIVVLSTGDFSLRL